MEILSALLPGIHWWPVNSLHKGQWRGALTFSLICAWINSWINNHEAGDLRRHHAYYDIIVMGVHDIIISRFCTCFVFCCDSILTKLTHILQDYFTGIKIIGPPSATTLTNMGRYILCIHKGLWYNQNKAKHSKTLCIFHEIYYELF